MAGLTLVASSSLPLPVARLHRRSFNAKSAKDRHDTAYFAWEVSVRLGVAAAPPTNAGSLARASVGQWCAALKPKDRSLDDPALLALYASLTEAATGTRSERKSVTPRDLLDALPAYRNKVLGHGSARAPTFYEDSGRALLTALEVAWREHLFLSEGATLVHVDAVALDASGGRVARALDLSSETPVVLDRGASAVPDSVLPGRLYLKSEAGWRALHPWLLYHEESERLWCFNGLGRRAEYLDYASGETLGGAELEKAFRGSEAALRALFGAGVAATEAAVEPKPSDERRFGDYEVLGKLGEGGMGAVYLARQTSLGRTVALKMLPPERAKDPVAVGRFQREVRALARCEHPNVVKIYASGEARGTHYYAMEFVDGADLGKVAHALSSSPDFDSAVSSAFEVARSERAELFPGLPPVPRRPATTTTGEDRWQQMARFFAQAACGLAHLHENGIVHRDISPGNVMVTWPDERAVIMDLGLAAVENATVTLTKDKSAILGTLRYIAPEQLQRHLVDVDRRVDVYSFGATMYELLGGRPIFDGETEPRLITQILREEPRLLSKVEPRLPAELAHIVHKALEKDPARRYPSAADLAADLEAYLAGEPITAQAPTLLYRARRWARRRRELVAGAGIVLLLASVAIVFLVRNASRIGDEVRVSRLTAQLDRLNKDQAGLTPLDPAGISQWLARAGELVGEVEGLRELRAEFVASNARATPVEASAVPTLVESDAALRSLAERQQTLHWLESVLAAREGRAIGAIEPMPPATLAPYESMLWEQLNEAAWPLVNPWRSTVGSEDLGLALAQRSMELAPAERRHEVEDTLAWGLLAAGRHAEALGSERRALEQANAEQQPLFLASLERMQTLAESAVSPEQMDILRRWIAIRRAGVEVDEAHRERLTAAVFESEHDRRLDTSLCRLLRSLEILRRPQVGVLAWVEAMRARADEVARVRFPEGEPSAEWRRAVEDIARSSVYAGLRIAPDAQLVPLGADPVSGLHEFACVATGSVPKRDARTGGLQIGEDSAVVLVLLPGGSMRLGASPEDEADPLYDSGATENESGIHRVELDPFLIAKHELTQAQWFRMTREYPSGFLPGRPMGPRLGTWRNPVENVSWKSAQETLRAYVLELPSEAQWEYAARGGTTSSWWTGEDADSLEGAANLWDVEFSLAIEEPPAEDTSPDRGRLWSDGFVATAPIGSFRPNPFGLHDTAGNVWELCRDPIAPGAAAFRDGDGLRIHKGREDQHVRRGGSWDAPAVWLRSAARSSEQLTGTRAEPVSPTTGVRPIRVAHRSGADGK